MYISFQAYWCGYLNSACNPIIYAFRSPSFRQGYLEIILRKKKGSVLPGGGCNTMSEQGYSGTDTGTISVYNTHNVKRDIWNLHS